MNTLKMKLLFGVIILIGLLPNSTQAYFTTEQTATRLTDDTILFTVTYEFGFANRELYMPIGTERGENDVKSPYIKYQIFSSENTATEIGKANGLVLSSDKDVQVKDNQYYLAPGRGAKFTLVTLLNIPKEQQDSDLFLRVTNLPFTMVDKGQPIRAQLNPSELQYYKTPSISNSDQIKIIAGPIHTLNTK